MSKKTKKQLQLDNKSKFPNNNIGLITPDKLREFNSDIIDTLITDEILNNQLNIEKDERILADTILLNNINNIENQIGDLENDVDSKLNDKQDKLPIIIDGDNNKVFNEQGHFSQLNHGQLDPTKMNIDNNYLHISENEKNSYAHHGYTHGESIKTVKEVEELITPNSINILYTELLNLRDNSELTPGMWYRITDYETTTTQTETRSAGHLFDVIVLALSEDTLSEDAKAIHSDRDTGGYFSESNLSVWNLKYCLDNDINRFNWCEITPGVLKLEGNIVVCGGDIIIPSGPYYCKYDVSSISEFIEKYNMVNLSIYSDENFTNIIDAYFYVGLDSTDDEFLLYDDLCGNENIVSVSILSEVKKPEYFKGVIYQMVDDKYNNLPYDFKNIQFLHNGDYLYTIGGYEDDTNKKNSYSYNNKIGQYINNGLLTIPKNLFNNVIYNNTIGYDSNNNTIDYIFNNNTIGNYFQNNTIGNYFQNNNILNYFEYNTIGNNFYSNNLGNNFNNNNIGNVIEYNIIGSTFGYNIIGNKFRYNNIGIGCNYLSIVNNTEKLEIKNGVRGKSNNNKLILNVDGANVGVNTQRTLYQSYTLRYILKYFNHITEDVYYKTIGNETSWTKA